MKPHPEYKNYDTTLDGVKETLDKYGVAVVKIFSEEECRMLRNGIWDGIGRILQGRFDIHDKSTWREFYTLFPIHSMLVQHFQVGHLQSVWDVRQHPKVAEVFARIHAVDAQELLTSFDGVSLHLPHEETKRGHYRGNNWLHTDQSPLNKDYCVQGFVNLYPVGDGDATLSILEGSHNKHAEILGNRTPPIKSNWYKLSGEDEAAFAAAGCKQFCVKAEVGTLVLWDSRTIHQGIEPTKTRQAQNFRSIVYVCQTPRAWATEKDLEKKRKYFEEKRMTTHWPHKVKVFGKNPRTYGVELPATNSVPTPILTDLGKRLANF